MKCKALSTSLCLFVLFPAGFALADKLPAVPGGGVQPLPNAPGSSMPHLPAGTLQVVKPDLVIQRVLPGPGAQRPAVITVRNIGNGGSGSAVGLKLGCRQISTSSNCQPSASTVGSVPPLAPGAGAQVTVEVTGLSKSRSTPLRDSEVYVNLNSDRRVSESSMANNSGSGRW